MTDDPLPAEHLSPLATLAVTAALSSIPEHQYTHLADSDLNPADALATVGADIAAFGPG